ncbi:MULTISPECIES: helix-turn-helix domain-containing protein [Haloferax]|uniref:Helix-turn-helix domain-containing protein n=2 Tax=Haloferax TaxID=2251 RepID=A0A6G1Z4R5_9EURY|nr:helix-turn-helix domain-containing protein [Haloferax marinisediminis]KAB1189281.1 helix-turn-helix transcriptional regulator [Haloferax sp. CBA1149]MRW81532.1 helix-turn-helix domain-containing protein [Haloferax marinisediminis]
MQTGLRRNPLGPTRTEAHAEQVLDALSDRACRRILTTVQGRSEPMTAQELSVACDIPLSTTYRKLERLSDARLLEETLQLRMNGTHTHQYRSDVESVTVSLDEETGLEVDIPGGH